MKESMEEIETRAFEALSEFFEILWKSRAFFSLLSGSVRVNIAECSIYSELVRHFDADGERTYLSVGEVYANDRMEELVTEPMHPHDAAIEVIREMERCVDERLNCTNGDAR